MHESEKKCIGIDVGGTSVKIGLFETDGTLLFKWEVPTRKEEGGRYILEDVAASIREVLTDLFPLTVLHHKKQRVVVDVLRGKRCGGVVFGRKPVARKHCLYLLVDRLRKQNDKPAGTNFHRPRKLFALQNRLRHRCARGIVRVHK